MNIMEPRLAEIAERVRSVRELMGISPEVMGKELGMSAEEYLKCEQGAKDFSFMFLYHCAEKFGMDMVELLTGENPHLSGYSIVRNRKGLSMERRRGFDYYHLAANFKSKIMEPFLVVAPFNESDQENPIAQSVHEGQEMDYILEGTLRFNYGNHTEILNAGDTVYYNSGRGHGMIAIGGKPCTFLALVMKDNDDKEDTAVK
jgi:mannose-6-phosphate isomerase-like protein (cupin superfamily)